MKKQKVKKSGKRTKKNPENTRLPKKKVFERDEEGSGLFDSSRKDEPMFLPASVDASKTEAVIVLEDELRQGILAMQKQIASNLPPKPVKNKGIFSWLKSRFYKS